MFVIMSADIDITFIFEPLSQLQKLMEKLTLLYEMHVFLLV